MTKRRNLAGDLNKSPMKEKSPMRDIPKSTKPNYTLDKIEKVIFPINRIVFYCRKLFASLELIYFCSIHFFATALLINPIKMRFEEICLLISFILDFLHIL
jgi:hypothetical protein